jgi:hypothetical protein
MLALGGQGSDLCTAPLRSLNCEFFDILTSSQNGFDPIGLATAAARPCVALAIAVLDGF